MKKNYRGLIDSESIILGDELLIALYTPGHFIDSMSFWDKKNNSIFTGDTIFVGRPGRTVSNTSNIKDLYKSIYNKIGSVIPASSNPLALRAQESHSLHGISSF